MFGWDEWFAAKVHKGYIILNSFLTWSAWHGSYICIWYLDLCFHITNLNENKPFGISFIYVQCVAVTTS